MKTFRRIVSRFSIRSALFVMTVGAAPCAWGAPAWQNGNQLMKICTHEGANFLGKCIGYLEGIADSQDTLAGWHTEKSLICVPKGTESPQLRQVFLNYMTTRPQDWHYGASGLVLDAFSRAWPCSE